MCVCVCVCVCRVYVKEKVLVAQSCPTLCNPMNCSLPGSFVHGILQARILKWVAIPVYRGSSQPKDWTQTSCTEGRFFTVWATREYTSLTVPFFCLYICHGPTLSLETKLLIMTKKFLQNLITITIIYFIFLKAYILILPNLMHWTSCLSYEHNFYTLLRIYFSSSKKPHFSYLYLKKNPTHL